MYTPSPEEQDEGLHNLRVRAEFVWCTRCAGYAAYRPRKLAAACTGRKNAAGRTILKALEKGLSPTYHYDSREGRRRRIDITCGKKAETVIARKAQIKGSLSK